MQVGEGALFLATAATACAAALGIAGALDARPPLVDIARRLQVVSATCIALALLVLAMAFWRSDFSLRIVADNSSVVLSRPVALVALWTTPAGWLLLVALGVALVAVLVRHGAGVDDDRMLASGMVAALVLVLLLMLLRGQNPFAISTTVPPDGRGLDSRWHLSWPAIAPLGAALAAAVLAAPAALALAWLARGGSATRCAVALRRWLALAVLCLTIAMLLRFAAEFAEQDSLDWPVRAARHPVVLLWVACTVALGLVESRPAFRAPERWRRISLPLVVAGVLALLLSATGVAFRSERTAIVMAGRSTAATDPFGRRWSFVGQGISTFAGVASQTRSVPVDVRIGDTRRGIVATELRRYANALDQEWYPPRVESGRLSVIGETLTITLLHIVGEDSAAVRFAFYPLLGALWVGGALIAAGAAFLAAPDSR